jgi:hypothetical protein
VDARSILGLRALRTPFLDHVSTAQTRRTASRRAQACRTGLVTPPDLALSPARRYVLDDEEEDEDDDEDRDPDDEDDENDDEEDEDEEETWQVSDSIPFR